MKYLKHTNLKIVSTSFSGLRTVTRVYGEHLVRKNKYFPILDVILLKLQEHNADKMVKVSVIKCLGPIFESIFERLEEKHQNRIL